MAKAIVTAQSGTTLTAAVTDSGAGYTEAPTVLGLEDGASLTIGSSSGDGFTVTLGKDITTKGTYQRPFC